MGVRSPPHRHSFQYSRHLTADEKSSMVRTVHGCLQGPLRNVSCCVKNYCNLPAESQPLVRTRSYVTRVCLSIHEPFNYHSERKLKLPFACVMCVHRATKRSDWEKTTTSLSIFTGYWHGPDLPNLEK